LSPSGGPARHGKTRAHPTTASALLLLAPEQRLFCVLLGQGYDVICELAPGHCGDPRGECSRGNCRDQPRAP
jgi:hypothetical protein